MSASDNPVIIVGAGLTGLTVAYRLMQSGVDAVIVEQGARLGGQIHTVHEDGLVVELGAEGFVARSESLPRLCRDLGIESELIDQRTTDTCALQAGALIPLPPGEAARILGFQVPKEELGRGIRSLRGGMGSLIDALASALDARVAWRRGSGVVRVGGGTEHLEVELSSGEVLAASRVVITAPAARASEMLASLAPDTSRALAGQRTTSNASATLLYDAASIGCALDASGFIVPVADDPDALRACSFVTTKFDRATPPGLVLLRAFFRPTVEGITARDEAGWIELAARSVAGPLAITGAPRRGWASAWPAALPVYDSAWRAAVARADADLAPLGVLLAGSHFHGAGIDAAVLSAERAAAAISSGRARPPPARR